MKILQTYDTFELCDMIDEFNLCYYGFYNYLIYDYDKYYYFDDEEYIYDDKFNHYTIQNAKSELTYTEFDICKNAQEIFKSSIFNDFQDFEQQFREIRLTEYEQELKLLNIQRLKGTSNN